MDDLTAVLGGARTVGLVHWPHQDVPATLMRAGFAAYGHEHDGLRRYLVVGDAPAGARSSPLGDDGACIAAVARALPR